MRTYRYVCTHCSRGAYSTKTLVKHHVFAREAREKKFFQGGGGRRQDLGGGGGRRAPEGVRRPGLGGVELRATQRVAARIGRWRMLHHTSNMYPNWDRRRGDVKLYVTNTRPNTQEGWVASYVHTNRGCDCTFSIWGIHNNGEVLQDIVGTQAGGEEGQCRCPTAMKTCEREN